MKKLISALALTLLATPVFADEPPPAPDKFIMDTDYLLKLTNPETKVCGPNWIPVRMLGYSERKDVIGVRPINTQSFLTVELAGICDSQKGPQQPAAPAAKK